MKIRQFTFLILILTIIGLVTYIVYDKFIFTEEKAKITAKRFFSVLMINGHEGFNDIYPEINRGSRIVTNKLCRINNIVKRDDGNYVVYASYDPSRYNKYQISIVINKKGKIVSSRGISYAFFDKTLEYAKKLGCLTGDENDVEIERVIREKNLRSKLDAKTNLALVSIYNSLEIKSSLQKNFGFISGNVVVTNNSPYNLEFGEISCSINYYNSRGDIIESDDLYINDIDAYSSKSTMAVPTSTSISSYRVVKDIKTTDALKRRVKDQIINITEFGCD